MKKLYRSKTNKMIAGIFGGLAEQYDMDASVLRIIFAFLVIMTGFFPLMLLYIIALAVIPEEPKALIVNEGEV